MLFFNGLNTMVNNYQYEDTMTIRKGSIYEQLLT